MSDHSFSTTSQVAEDNPAGGSGEAIAQLNQKPKRGGKKRALLFPPFLRHGKPQLAGWTPKVLSEPQYRVTLEADLEVRLSDGTILCGDLYRPSAAGSFPTLIAWAPYTKELQTSGIPLPINEVGDIRYVVSRGYCHLTVNARGTGKSGGQRPFQFSPSEVKDVTEAIEWVAAQPWCDGNVGMIGMSAFAVIQYLAAAQQPQHLKAIFPYLGFTDLYRHFIYHGGAFHSDCMAAYYTFVGSSQKIAVPPLLRHLLSYIFRYQVAHSLISRYFFRNETKMIGRLHPQEDWMRDYAKVVFDEPYDSQFYREKSAWPILKRIQLPVCIGTNWGNPGLHMKGAFQAWATIPSTNKKLFIGPPDPQWPWSSYQEELLAWYDYYLKGLETGVRDLPAVRYWLQGANRWREASAWPIPGATKQRLYLTTLSANTFARHSLQVQQPQQESTLSFVAIPRGMLYPKELESYENQVLRYETSPFVQDTEIVGPILLSLTLSSTAIDTYLIARVSDLSPDGKVQKLSFGWLQASHREVDFELSRPDEVIHTHTAPEALRPHTSVQILLSLTPMANLFKEGHCLVLEIGSNPDLLGGELSEGFIYYPCAAPPYPARNTIHHGGKNACYIEYEVRID